MSESEKTTKKKIPIALTLQPTMNTPILTLIALIAIADAWKVKLAGAFGDTKCDITSVGSAWQVSFMGTERYTLASFSQQPSRVWRKSSTTTSSLCTS